MDVYQKIFAIIQQNVAVEAEIINIEIKLRR